MTDQIIARPTFMTVSHEYPPNFDVIASVLPQARKPGVLFTYGNTIHNPSGRPLSSALLAHEETHARQQQGGPGMWWRLYLTSIIYRYEQEREAHVAEYRAVLEGENNRNNRRAMFMIIATRLSGPLYGHMITLADAKKMLKHEGKKA